MSRIKLHMSGTDVIQVMMDGNPGGMSVMLKLMENTKTLDPQAAMGPMHHILSLDTLELYGPAIWVLFKDVCGEDIEKVIAVLRGWQLGIVSDVSIQANVRKVMEMNGPSELDVDEILLQVKDRLPEFGA